MMSVEGPFLAAVIARLADPTFNLAAYGVAFAFGILTEAPVIMLMSASTALVEDADTYYRLRNFTWVISGLATALLVLLLLPPVHELVMVRIIDLPPRVAEITHGALLLLLPWPAAIGIRRFLQGLLIRSGRTRWVAAGTVIRLTVMSSTALALATLTSMPGAWVAGGALSAGVVSEAVAARLMTLSTVRSLSRQHGDREPGDGDSYLGILHFYIPLALTSMIGLTVQPALTFFMGRARAPLESLAVFPVVNALSFIFRSFGLSFQEAAIALLGRRNEHLREVATFGLVLALATSAGLALVAFTPLAGVWFETVSGLTPDLTSYALIPARILAPLPALSVVLSLQRAILVQGRRTRPITGATLTEVTGIVLIFTVFGWGFDLVGVTAAIVAFVGGRLGGNLFLVPSCRRVLARP